jgi:hypothetical protein
MYKNNFSEAHYLNTPLETTSIRTIGHKTPKEVV